MANTNNPNKGTHEDKRKNLNEDREPMSNPTGAREKQGGSKERDIERERRRSDVDSGVESDQPETDKP